MVLHNSKWDRKATRRYNKKHGISASKVEDQSETHRKWRKGDELNDSEEDRSSDGSDGDGSDKDGKLSEVIQQEGDDLEAEPLEADNLESLDKFDILDSPDGYFPELEDEKEYNELVELSKKLILKQREQEAHNNADINRYEDVILQDNLEEYYKLQNDIEHSKMVDSIKNRFGRKRTDTAEAREMNEQDFDDFLHDIDSSNTTSLPPLDDKREIPASLGGRAKLDSTKEEWLDGLLGS
jgi:hypothetical protein